jgi:hypothetical protein
MVESQVRLKPHESHRLRRHWAQHSVQLRRIRLIEKFHYCSIVMFTRCIIGYNFVAIGLRTSVGIIELKSFIAKCLKPIAHLFVRTLRFQPKDFITSFFCYNELLERSSYVCYQKRTMQRLEHLLESIHIHARETKQRRKRHVEHHSW